MPKILIQLTYWQGQWLLGDAFYIVEDNAAVFYCFDGLPRRS